MPKASNPIVTSDITPPPIITGGSQLQLPDEIPSIKYGINTIKTAGKNSKCSSKKSTTSPSSKSPIIIINMKITAIIDATIIVDINHGA